MSEFRGFIAIEIPCNEKILKFHNDISQTSCNLNLVKPKNIHITLKFLGKTKKEYIPEITDIIKQSTSVIQPFSIKLQGTGVFPNKNYIKVIWVGITNSDKLDTISASLHTKLESLGFKKDTRGFSPHITIARVKSAKGKEQLLSLLDIYKDTLFDKLIISKIKLKESTLTPKGPIYNTLNTIQLKISK